MPWKTRRRGTANQRGKHFLVGGKRKLPKPLAARTSKAMDFISQGYWLHPKRELKSEGKIISKRCIEAKRIISKKGIFVEIGDIGSQTTIKSYGKIQAKHGYIFAKDSIEAPEIEAEFIYSPRIIGKIKGCRVSLDELNDYLSRGKIPKRCKKPNS
jgi:hypothetical protein